MNFDGFEIYINWSTIWTIINPKIQLENNFRPTNVFEHYLVSPNNLLWHLLQTLNVSPFQMPGSKPLYKFKNKPFGLKSKFSVNHSFGTWSCVAKLTFFLSQLLQHFSNNLCKREELIKIINKPTPRDKDQEAEARSISPRVSVVSNLKVNLHSRFTYVVNIA